jgi:hypothetical protein
MTAATQQDIESWLWESANILRGPVDPANLRDFVFPLLFLKRLSDTWDEEQQKAIERFSKDINDDIAADFHRFQIPKGCHWTDLRRAAENQGVLIQQMTQKIEEANPELLAQIFGNAPWADHNKISLHRRFQMICSGVVMNTFSRDSLTKVPLRQASSLHRAQWSISWCASWDRNQRIPFMIQPADLQAC